MKIRILLAACVAASATIGAQSDALQDALRLGRTHDVAMFDAFNAGYRLTTSGEVESVEVITEFRRAVLIVREHADQGEYAFNENNLTRALAPYRGLVTFVAQVRLHPQNIYPKPPRYEMYVRTGGASPAIADRALKRIAVYPPGLAAPGASMSAVRLEASLPRADISNASEPALVVVNEQGDPLWQGRIDLSRFR
jgi:hypothetical protein